MLGAMAKSDKRRLNLIAEHLFKMRNSRERLEEELGALSSIASRAEMQKIYTKYVNNIDYHITLAEEQLPDDDEGIERSRKKAQAEGDSIKRFKKNKTSGKVEDIDFDDEVDFQPAHYYYTGRG
jgi:hypothetical protein